MLSEMKIKLTGHQRLDAAHDAELIQEEPADEIAFALAIRRQQVAELKELLSHVVARLDLEEQETKGLENYPLRAMRETIKAAIQS